MRRLLIGLTLCLVLASTLIARPAVAQRELVERSLSEVRNFGHEDAIVHLAEEIGAQGIEECLRHASRAGRLICAQSARYLEHPWGVLYILATVLQDHDRQVASRAAESMVIVLSQLEPDDLSGQEALPSEAEELLQGLRGVTNSELLSPDIVAQVVIAASLLAQLVGAEQQVAREALRHEEVAVRRAAATSLTGSSESVDIQALSETAARDQDTFTAAAAAAAVCEATATQGQQIPEPVVARARSLLGDRNMRPATIGPLLACLARATTPQVGGLRELAARHPNEGSRARWQELTSNAGRSDASR
jgi:hypothetical protein